MKKTYLVPDYYESFHCKCGACRHPCCDGWGINVNEHEYYTLLGLACTRRLRHKLDDAFVLAEEATPDAFASIVPNYLEQCPMLDEDGLCLLQKEKGEEVMPLICRLYPRAIKKYGDLHELAVSCSCEATVECLMQTKGPLTLHAVSLSLPFDGLPVYEFSPAQDQLRYRLIHIMCDERLPIVRRMLSVGSLLCRPVSSARSTRVHALESICRMAEDFAQASRSIREYSEAIRTCLSGLTPDEKLAQFDRAEDHLYEILPDVETYAGRIIANHMLYESFPFSPDCSSMDSAFAAFCLAVALLKLLCVTGCSRTTRVEDFVDILATANRFIEHSNFYKLCNRLDHPDGMSVFHRFASLLERHL